MRMRTTLAGIATAIGLAAGTIGVVGLVGSEPPVPRPPAVAAAETLSAPAPRESAPAAPAPPAGIGEPIRVRIPSIGVDAPLAGHGLNDDGSMTVPDFGDVGWYDKGPRPGEAGGAVIVAHVTGPDGPDAFFELATMTPGDRIQVQGSEGRATFVVEAVEDVPKDELPYDRIWPATDAPLLRLITCGGDRDAATGYPDNTVVYARLLHRS